MSKNVYTREQLQRLRNSPLVCKPDSLPPIEQWIEQSNEQGQRRPRPQSGIQSVKEDNAQSSKRPPLVEARSSTRHSYQGTGDENFIGSKSPFMTAAATRQVNKTFTVEDRNEAASSDDIRSRTERAQGRERPMRDREPREDGADFSRQRFERNGHQDDSGARGGRSQGAQRRTAENYGRPQPRVDDSETFGVDELDQKRAFGARGRADQPWVRDVKPEAKENDNLESIMSEKNWRGRDRPKPKEWSREPQIEQEPQWLKESDAADADFYTVQDFQKWKEGMKAGSKGADKPMIIEDDTPEPATRAHPSTPPRENTGDSAAPIDLFKSWAVPKVEDNLPGLGNTTPKASSKPKASRFAGFFAPTPQDNGPPSIETPQDHEINSIRSPVESQPMKTNTADQEGFARMMQMLRMNNTTQATSSTIALPGAVVNGQYKHSQASSVEAAPHTKDQRQSVTSPLQAAGPQPPLQQPQASKPIARPEPVSRDSEFLLKLMQQQYQQPKSPFTEGQIYGQSYSRKDSADLSSLLSSLTPRPRSQQLSQQPGQAHASIQGQTHGQTRIQAQPQPQPQTQPQPRSQAQIQGQAPLQPQPQATKPRAAPPGFFGNDRAYGANQQVEAMMQEQNPMSPVEGRLGGLPQRHMPPDPRFYQMSMPPFEQHTHTQPNRAPESVPPPPGFVSAPGAAPPGFFPFPGGPNTNMPQGLRQQMPPMAPPASFFNGPGGSGIGHVHPMSYGPQLQMQQQQQQLQQQQSGQTRRMSQLQSPVQMLPPGYEGMAQASARRPPGMMPPGIGPPSQGQYPQFLKQGGGVNY